VTFSDLVTEAVFSPDGEKIAALAKTGDQWKIVVEGRVWSNSFQMAWQPVFSPDSEHVAAKVETKGKYTIVVDDRLWERKCESLWDPVFSPDGQKILIRSIEDGVYYRRVLPLSDLV
jgi:predicted Rdx family selenoprotein